MYILSYIPQKYNEYNGKSISCLDVIWNSMMVLNKSRAQNRVNNKRALFEVRYSIEVPRTSRSGLIKTFMLDGYSSVLTYFTWNSSIYNSILILLTSIWWPQLLIGWLVLPADMKIELFGCSFLLLDLFVIVGRF